MKAVRKPDYGLDAPSAVRNLLIVGALGIISLIARLLGLWSRQDAIAAIARPLIGAGLGCGAVGLWMIYDSKIGKAREREHFLDLIAWRDAGVDARRVQGVVSSLLSVLTFGFVQSGYVIGSK